MKAVRVDDGRPQCVTVDAPRGDGVLVNVVSTSICGSDLHLLDRGAVEGRILGHEFAGVTADGTAVAIEPTLGCGACGNCVEGERRDCETAKAFMGISADGGMAEQVLVAAHMLVVLPSGLDVAVAALVEPLAVAAHGVRRVNPLGNERVAVIGAGPIGLATVAILRDRGIEPILFARHDHQKLAGESLGARLADDVAGGGFDGGGFDVVLDAVGTTASIAQAVALVRSRGRVGLVGTLWDPASIDMRLWSKEVALIPACGYSGVAPNRDFDVAARVLAERSDIADVMVTHRFSLDAAAEGFETAADRAAGAIKVLFEV